MSDPLEEILKGVEEGMRKLKEMEEHTAARPATVERDARMGIIAETKLKLKESKKRVEKKMEIRAILTVIKQAQNTDFLFVVDSTGSMGTYLAAVKDSVKSLTEQMQAQFKGVKFRVGMIAYRDHCDGANRLEEFPFTFDIDAFKGFVSRLKAFGGGDGPEDVNGALARARSFDWKHATRVICHIGDWPPHGSEFQSNFGDSYPSGHSLDVPFRDIFESYRQKEIKYFFGRITTYTDKMLEIFSGYKIIPIKSFDLSSPDKLLESVTEITRDSITESITTATVGAARAGKSRSEVPGEYVRIDKSLHPKTAELSDIKTEEVDVRVYEPPEDFEDLRSDLDLKGAQTLRVQIASAPFAKGTQKLAYAGKAHGTLSKGLPGAEQNGEVVFKALFRPSGSTGKDRIIFDRPRLLAEQEVHTIASFLADKFNDLGVADRQLKYISVALVDFGNRRDSPSFMMERVLDVERFSNNGLYLKKGAEYEIFHCFSHWTYHATDNYLMVVDIEGCITSEEYLLTDPSIHCRDELRFGKANLGVGGMRQFLDVHRCGNLCKKVLPVGALIDA